MEVLKMKYQKIADIKNLKKFCKENGLNYYAVCDKRHRAKVKGELEEFYYKDYKFIVK